MPLTTLTPQTVVHDVKLGTQSYKAVFNSTRIRSNIGQLDATVYSNEANGDFIPGIERLTLDFGGVLKQGGPEAGPLIPLPQNKAFETDWSGSPATCKVTGTCNFTEFEISRPAGQLGTTSGQAFSIGVFVVVWDTAP